MAATATATPQQMARARARTLASLLGRAQGPELLYNQIFTPLQAPIIPVRINLSRFLESIHLVWRGRIVIATGNYTSLSPEAPQNIIQAVVISGSHRVWNALTPVNMTGASIFAWPSLFQARGSALYIDSTSGTGVTPVRAPALGVPMGLPLTTIGNIGTYDVEIHYDIFMAPFLGLSGSIKEIPYFWNPRDWSDTLQIQLFFGDASSLGVPGTAVVTYFAYGTGAGSPNVEIHANYAILGPLADGIQSAVVVRNERTQTGGPVAAAGNAVRVQLLDKQKTTQVVVKSGTVTAAPSSGVQVYATLNDQLIDKTLLRVDNKPVKNNQSNRAMKEYLARQFNAFTVQGYLPLSFVEQSNDPMTAYRADRIAGGATTELVTDVPTTTVRQTIGVIQEEIYGTPGASF
jgi:hypothetical protein